MDWMVSSGSKVAIDQMHVLTLNIRNDPFQLNSQSIYGLEYYLERWSFGNIL